LNGAGGGAAIVGELKTPRSRRALALPAVVAAALAAHRERQARERAAAGEQWREHGLVFPSSIGTPLGPRNLTRAFHGLLARSGLARMRWHDLRHSAASILLAQGVDLRTVMEVLGHSQIGVTMDTYAHVTPALGRRAAELMDAALREGPCADEG
jgi:site-specific recombinase XerD